MYRIVKKDGHAKHAEFTTVHGTVQTPVFMNVGTVAAIKGAVATSDLEQIGTQIELIQYLSSACASRRPGGEEAGRTSQIYVMG